MNFKKISEAWKNFLCEQYDLEDLEDTSFDAGSRAKIKTKQTGKKKLLPGTAQSTKAGVAPPGKSLSPEKEIEKSAGQSGSKTGETIVIKTTKTGDGYSRSRDRNNPMDSSDLKNTKWVGIVNAVNIHDLIKSGGLSLDIFQPQRELGFGHPVTFEIIAQAHRKTMPYRGNKPNPPVGNVSHKTGGPQKQALGGRGRQYSRSHQHGLDIDIGYYTTGARNTINTTLLNSEEGFYKHFDLERNLIFLHDLLKNPKVNMVLIGENFKERILNMVEKREREELLVKQKQPSRTLEEQGGVGTATLKLEPDAAEDFEKHKVINWDLDFQDVPLRNYRAYPIVQYGVIYKDRVEDDFKRKGHKFYWMFHTHGNRYAGKQIGDGDLTWEAFREMVAEYIESGMPGAELEDKNYNTTREHVKFTTNVYKAMANGFRALENPLEKEDAKKAIQKTTGQERAAAGQKASGGRLSTAVLKRMALDLRRSGKIKNYKLHEDHIHIRANFPSNTITDKQYLARGLTGPSVEEIKARADKKSREKVENLKKEFDGSGERGGLIGFVFGRVNGQIIDSFNSKKRFYGASVNKPIAALVQLIKYKNNKEKQLTDEEMKFLLAYKGKSVREKYASTPGWDMANKINRRLAGGDREKDRVYNREQNKAELGTISQNDGKFLRKYFKMKNSGFTYGGSSNRQTPEDAFNFFATLERMRRLKDTDLSNNANLSEEQRFYKKYKEEIDRVITIQRMRVHKKQNTMGTGIPNSKWGKGGKAGNSLNIIFVVGDYVLVVYTAVDGSKPKFAGSDGKYAGTNPATGAPWTTKETKKYKDEAYERGYDVLRAVLKYFNEMVGKVK